MSYSQTVQNQHEANHHIVYEEIVEIPKEAAGQPLEIGHCFEIVEIEELRPRPHILPCKRPQLIESGDFRRQSISHEEK